MWRKTTIDAKIGILEEKKNSLEDILIDSLINKKEKKFITDAAEYVVMRCLQYCDRDSYYFNIEHDGMVSCGMIGDIPLKRFIRLKGIIVGLGDLYRFAVVKCRSNGADFPTGMMIAKTLRKAWKTIHDNDDITVDISFDDSKEIQRILDEIAIGLVNGGFTHEHSSLFNKLILDDDQLSLFFGMMSVPGISFEFREDPDSFNEIYMLGRFNFFLKDGSSLRERHKAQLADILTVFNLYKYKKEGVTFQPNTKYFFNINKAHRPTCFTSVALFNKLVHRGITEMCKYEKEGSNEK